MLTFAQVPKHFTSEDLDRLDSETRSLWLSVDARRRTSDMQVSIAESVGLLKEIRRGAGELHDLLHDQSVRRAVSLMMAEEAKASLKEIHEALMGLSLALRNPKEKPSC